MRSADDRNVASLRQEETVSPEKCGRAGVSQDAGSQVPPRRRFMARRQEESTIDSMPQKVAEEPPRRQKKRVLYLSAIAASVSPLHRYFSFSEKPTTNSANPFLPPCARCPNCKGCQLHMQFCSGAYGMRHLLSWIVHRRPPSAGERRTIELRCGSSGKMVESTALSQCGVCRFEVGPVVITRSIVYTSLEQTTETLQRGGKTGPFAGMACPRPLNFLDIFFSVFFGTTKGGRDKRRYRVIQRTAMRAVAGQARALWEKLTFSPEIDSRAASQPRMGDSNAPPRRVPVDWRYPPLFFSLLPNATVGNKGITFILWLSEVGRQALTAHVIEDEEFWRAPHTCRAGKEGEAEDDTPKPDPGPTRKWEGEVKCRRCYVPGSCWGLICRRQREDVDKTVSTLRARQSCTRKGVMRRTTLRNRSYQSPVVNEVIWMNKQKTRAQFMALLVGYMMRTTVCGPYRQRHLLAPPSEVSAMELSPLSS